MSSPLQRARRTAELAGLHDAQLDDDLVEWDYGDVEGITTKDWRATHPGWWLWREGPPGGETVDEVGARASRALERLEKPLQQGDVAVVAHGHLLRVLAAVWCGLPPAAGAHLRLDVACLSVLGHEHETRVILRWNNPVDTDPLI
jgi:probable phosphoglycerate mutase